MPTEMELRVAKALRDRDWSEDGMQMTRDDYIGLARAAIKAMREPTEDMIDMGGRGIARDTQYISGAMTLARYSSHEVEAQNRLRADAAWAAMIDAATSVEPEPR